MATFPSYETILLEIQQSFGLNSLQTVQKRRIERFEKPISEHHKMLTDIQRSILDELDLKHDPALVEDLLAGVEETIQFLGSLEMETRTFGANARRTIWHLLAFAVMAGLGRRYAFWSLEAPVAVGMPRGDLWVLPHKDPADPARLRLPVQTVAAWWLDLLGCPLEDIWNDAGADSRVRTLQNWRAGRLPNPEVIRTWFGQPCGFRYRGAFEDQLASPLEARYRTALDFVRDAKRGMDAVRLTEEIPDVPPAVFEAALAETGSDDIKAAFVEAVARRWRKPDGATLRRRFLIARTVQDGYCRLVTLLTPDTDPTCPDPAYNKALQLMALFTSAYDLTREAEGRSKSVVEAEQRFTALVQPWLADGFFRSIMPQTRDDMAGLGRILTDRFRAQDDTGGIPDLFDGGHLRAGPAPESVDPKVQAERRDLECLLAELDQIFDGSEAGRAACAEALVHQIAAHPRVGEYEADRLYYEGRHLLSQNNVDGARVNFEAAFEACKHSAYGRLRKEIAYACWGAAMGFGRFNPKSEQYFRVIARMLDPSEAGGQSPASVVLDTLFRDQAVRAFDHFWDNLYRPYPGVEVLEPPNRKVYGELLSGFLNAVYSNDADALDCWVADNRLVLDKSFHDVRGDTFSSVVLKLLNSAKATVHHEWAIRAEWGSTVAEAASRLRTGLHRVSGQLARKGLEAADFKGQTALMLAADHGDQELVQILLDRGVDFDAQDHLGRTALHAAGASQSTPCFLLLLEKGADPTKTTIDGFSPLHTAIKFGMVQAVTVTLQKWSNRFKREELMAMRDMAQMFHAEFKRIRPLFAVDGRNLGPRPAYARIAEVLSASVEKHSTEGP